MHISQQSEFQPDLHSIIISSRFSVHSVRFICSASCWWTTRLYWNCVSLMHLMSAASEKTVHCVQCMHWLRNITRKAQTSEIRLQFVFYFNWAAVYKLNAWNNNKQNIINAQAKQSIWATMHDSRSVGRLVGRFIPIHNFLFNNDLLSSSSINSNALHPSYDDANTKLEIFFSSVFSVQLEVDGFFFSRKMFNQAVRISGKIMLWLKILMYVCAYALCMLLILKCSIPFFSFHTFIFNEIQQKRNLRAYTFSQWENGWRFIKKKK